VPRDPDDAAAEAVARISALLDALAEIENDDLVWLQGGRTNADTSSGRRAMAAMARLRPAERELVERFYTITQHGESALRMLLDDEAIRHP
jgi:hypothetical protein